MKWVALFSVLSLALAAVQERPQQRDFYLEGREDQSGAFALMAIKGANHIRLGEVGREASTNDPEVTLMMTTSEELESGGWRLSLTWEGPSDRVFEDCFDFGDQQWFAGPEQKEQYWPIQNSKLQKYSIIAKEDDNSAISERYWVNSGGLYIYVAPEVPLFVDYHNSLDNHLCLIAEVTDPYSTRRTRNILKYDVWFFDNAKIAHLHAVENYLGKPSGIPDYRMIQYPIWSTWARLMREFTPDSLLAYANEINDNGFPNAQFDIDDLWEICYGSLTVDETKLPDYKELIEKLHSLGFRVSTWVHPFINKNCEPWYSEALEKGYLVLNEQGNPDTSWWNNNGSVPSYIDFTNPDATAWYTSNIQKLIDTYDFDTIKFDAGESSWSPQIPVQNGDIELHPGNIVQAFVRAVAPFGPAIEIRTGMRTQDLPVFVRIVDKDTYWGINNGLITVITNILAMNLNGYPFVLPDMIGGNGYNESPSKELFIRWLQVNVFMPSMQYSFVPWDYDAETVEISRKYTFLHADYAEEIVAAMQASVRDGTPVNPPIWWIDPEDKVALAISDEFLLGVKILAAPVVEEGAVARDIYLPRGTWRDGNTGELIVGPTWLNNYPAPLDTLPYFTLEN